MARKAASNKGPVAQPPSAAPKAIPFPRLSEKSHIRCHTFLEDQILLLSVRPFIVPILFCLDTETTTTAAERADSSGMPIFCRLY